MIYIQVSYNIDSELMEALSAYFWPMSVFQKILAHRNLTSG